MKGQNRYGKFWSACVELEEVAGQTTLIHLKVYKKLLYFSSGLVHTLSTVPHKKRLEPLITPCLHQLYLNEKRA